MSDSKTYVTRAPAVYTFEKDGDYIVVDNWFEQLKKSVDDWLKDPFTVKQFEYVKSVISDTLVKKENNITCVHKHILILVLKWLNSDALTLFVYKKTDVEVLVVKNCDTIHVRISDGYISMMNMAEKLAFKPVEFIKSDVLKNLVTRFGPVVITDDSGVWMHPIVIVPLLLWIDSLAAIELLGVHFMKYSNIPNMDSIVPLIKKNAAIKAQGLQKNEPNETKPSDNQKNEPNEAKLSDNQKQ